MFILLKYMGMSKAITSLLIIIIIFIYFQLTVLQKYNIPDRADHFQAIGSV